MKIWCVFSTDSEIINVVESSFALSTSLYCGSLYMYPALHSDHHKGTPVGLVHTHLVLLVKTPLHSKCGNSANTVNGVHSNL